ncbi:HAMP domain-containing sensor histidine kinase [Hymenobacter sp. M29]|uniref:histidine kinase n=1 Tax=Hymenobacter mellowenesis TaxID=3063995 RepID=A0ABT9A5V1_9BACT|nr:HAMP domain-containing sensor histidine kinase [Hymenobacter sp. M29]MDO7845217.1 HAMP domain-containing sensor histidine kinase [Hymenobacter sp. M29]
MLAPPEPFHYLLEGSQHASFIYNVSTGRLLYVSAAYETLFPGHRRENAPADLPLLLSYLPAEDQAYARKCFADLADGQLHDDLLLRVQPRPDTPLRWLCVRAHRSATADGQVLLSGTVDDVTVDQEYIRNADKYMAKKNTTLEILSHDLAGPFNMLQQLAEYIGEKTQPLNDPQVQKMLGLMRDTCRDSVNLIRDFVDGEFMDSASVELKRTRVDLVLALRQVVETYQQGERLVAKHFHFEPAQATLFVEIDNNKFLQVINNLMSNAIKFTREGGRITVRVEQQPQHVLVTVADDGIGIPPALLPVLFDRFTKARRPGLRGEKTTGLGMHIIQTIVRLHHGRIWVESTEQHGTTFYIQLPSPTASLAE